MYVVDKIGLIAREIAITLAEADSYPDYVQHVIGSDNVWPDALSLLWVPEPSSLPVEPATLPSDVFPPAPPTTTSRCSPRKLEKK
eukprot:1168442-Amphidinium_carterae.2